METSITRTRSKFAIPALILGILSLVPFLGFATFIPAVLLGILAIRDSRRTPHLKGGGFGWAAVVMGGLSGVLALIAGLSLLGALLSPIGKSATPSLEAAEKVGQAISQAVIDGAVSGEDVLPADLKASSSEEMWKLLQQKGIVSSKDLRALPVEQFQFANLSLSDPPETILLISREGVPGPLVVVTKDGRVFSFSSTAEAARKVKSPPRSPKFLQ